MSHGFPPLGPEFEPFLDAVVGNEKNGMPLTIISAIARSGADPWKEAARIAKLPRNAALDVLARMIPDCSGADGAAIAGRIFALLPVSKAKRIIPVAEPKEAGPSWSPVVPIIVVLLVSMALVSVFRTPAHSDKAPVETPSSPAADKTDR